MQNNREHSVENTVDSKNKTHYWQSMIDAWRDSGETKIDYCRRHQLSYHRFKYYFYQLRERQWPSAKPPVRVKAKKKSNKTASMTMVPVILTPISSHYDVIFPSGVIIKIPLSNSLTS